MCEYSGRSYEVFVNKMLQSCCSLTATHVQCYCDRRAVTLQCGLQQSEIKVSFSVVVTDVLHHLSNEGKLGGGQ